MLANNWKVGLFSEQLKRQWRDTYHRVLDYARWYRWLSLERLWPI